MTVDFLDAFGTSTALAMPSGLDNLAAGSIAWSDPVTQASPGKTWLEIAYQFKSHASTAPTDGTVIEIYMARADNNGTQIRDIDNTLTSTAKGTSSTAAAVTRCRRNMELVATVMFDANTAVIYQGVFYVETPGTEWQLLVYNGLGNSSPLNATGSTNFFHYRYVNDEAV